MAYEYCYVPDAFVDEPSILSYVTGMSVDQWLNLGAEASKKVGNGQKEIFFFIGDYASAALKFRREFELENGYVLFSHCREK